MPLSIGLTDFGDEKTVKSLTGDKNANCNQNDFHHWSLSKGRNERPSNCLQISKYSKKRPIFTGRHVHPSNVLSDFVARTTVIVLTGQCSFSTVGTGGVEKNPEKR